MIALAIVGITWNAIKAVWFRLMDAVDPGIIDRLEHFASEADGVEQVTSLRAHWVGHRLYAETVIVVDETLSLVEGHAIAVNVERAMHEAVPHLNEVSVHVDPRAADS